MVHFLREWNNRTLIECEVYAKDLSAAVYLENYSLHLTSKIGPLDRLEFISDFESLNEIRGSFWENELEDQDINKFVAEKFEKAAKKWGLTYVTD